MPMFVVLSAVAGFVDAACFMALSQVFTAHVTGNFAALASALVKPDGTTGLRVAVIGAFAGGAVCALCAARAMEARGVAGATTVRRAVIRVEAAWLALLLVLDAVVPAGAWARYAVALCAGAAMGCQSAPSKLPGEAGIGTPTTVMTSNFSAWTLALAQCLTCRAHERRGALDRTLVQLSLQLLLFMGGAAAGALGEQRFGVLALVVPMALLLVLTFAPPRGLRGRRQLMVDSRESPGRCARCTRPLKFQGPSWISTSLRNSFNRTSCTAGCRPARKSASLSTRL